MKRNLVAEVLSYFLLFIFALSIVFMVIATQSGFIASPSYLTKTVYIEYVVAISIVLFLAYQIFTTRKWNWKFAFLPMVAFLFARIWVASSVPYVADFFATKSVVTESFEVKSKQSVRRCNRAIQLTSNINQRIFDKFNFCELSLEDYDSIEVGRVITLRGNGSMWGFYPAHYKVASESS